MSKSRTVGNSYRTPAKHALMNRIIGREAAVLGMLRRYGVKRAVWLDLTAGNGVALLEPWERNCSPGLLAYHASRSEMPIPLEIRAYEIQAQTAAALSEVLSERLPEFGYEMAGSNEWVIRRSASVRFSLIHGSGREATLDGIDGQTAVLLSNDPNAITDWAMRPTMREEIAALTSWCRSISTMGCNPAGLKRLHEPERLQWFEHIEGQVNHLPPHHDLLLAKIDGDDAQWAYLIEEPIGRAEDWRPRTTKEACGAFEREGMTLTYAWYRDGSPAAWRNGATLFDAPMTFHEIQRELFLTKRERGVLV